MKLKLFLFAALSLLAAVANAELGEVADSTCRINAKQSYGTGFDYKEDDSYYYLLTAGHLIGIKDGVSVTLYHGGADWTVPAELVYHTYKEQKFLDSEDATKKLHQGYKEFCQDVSVVRIEKKPIIDSGHGKMVIMPFALNYNAKPLTFVWTYGCPDGNWPSGVKGRIIAKHNHLIEFQPKVIPGRSGSALYDYRCENVIGIVVMCNNTSYAILIDDVYEMLKEKGLEPDVESNTNKRVGPVKI